jgi:lipopolysaccharide exporter
MTIEAFRESGQAGRAEEPGTPGSQAGHPLEAEASAPRRPKRHGSFGSDVLKLVTGTVFAQGISIVLSPFLTRLYGPSAFGVWAIFSSITSIVGVVACLRYEVTIVLPERDEDGASLLGASLLTLTVTSLACLGAVLAGRSLIVSILKAPEIAPWLYLVPVAVFVNGVVLALSSWLGRRRRFGLLSSARVGASATSSAVQLGLGYAGAATSGSLIASSIAGTSVSGVVLGTSIVRVDGKTLRLGFRWKRLREGMHRYREFPKYGALSVLLNTISWQLPAIMLQRFFSAEVVGLYALGNRLLRLPMDLLGGAISQAFFPRAAVARTEGTLASVVEAAYRRLVTVSLAPTLVLGLVASDIFQIVFGARWIEAGVYTQILSLWTFFWFISSPLSSLFSVLEMQGFGLKLNVVILTTRFLSLAAGGLMGSPRFALGLFAATGAIVYSYYSFAILAAAGVRWSRALRILGSSVVAATPIVAVLLAGKLAGASPWVETVAAALLLGAFGVVVVRRDPALLAILKGIKLKG